MSSPSSPRQPGSYSVKKRKSPLGWLPWVGLLLLLLLAGLIYLVLVNANDKNDKPGVDLTNDSASSASGGNCPSATAAGQQLFTGISGIVGCRVDTRATVGTVADDNTFTLTSGGASVIVVDGSKGAVLQQGQRIHMTGTVKVFHFDSAASELHLKKSKASYKAIEGKTVVLADSTTPA